jgi:PAS domain S-box-containing protein
MPSELHLLDRVPDSQSDLASMLAVVDAFDRLGEGACVVDANGSILAVNQRMREMLDAAGDALVAGLSIDAVPVLTRNDQADIDITVADMTGGRVLYRAVPVLEQSDEDALIPWTWLSEALSDKLGGVAIFDTHDRLLQCNEKFRQNLLKGNAAPEVGRRFEDLVREFAANGLYVFEGDTEAFIAKRIAYHRDVPSWHEQRYANGTHMRIDELPIQGGATLVIQTDVTRDRVRERVLSETQDMYRAVVDLSLDAIFIVRGEDGEILFANQAASDLLGLSSPDELIGRTLVEYVEAKDRASVRDRCRAVMRGETVERGVPAQMIRSDGTKIDVERSMNPCELSGEPVGIAVARNVSDYVRANETLRTLYSAVEQSASGILITDTDGIIEYANSRFQEMSGYATEDLIGQSQGMLKTGRRAAQAYQDMLDTLRSGESWRGELMSRRKSGEFYWSAEAISPVRDNRGDVRHFLTVQDDITDRKVAELAQLQAKEEAELANRAKSEFLANMSHELRTPLNAIIGFSEIINEAIFGPLGNERYEEYIREIHQSGQHLLGIINDVLDISRVEAGRLELNEEPLSLQDIVDVCLRMIGPKARAGHLELVKHMPADLPLVRGDERLVKQVILNLLSNAVKFTEPGGKVRVNAGLTGEGDLALVISDTGIGMTESETRSVMEKFVQADSSLARKYDGSGLGLPLSRAFMQLHEGALELTSAPGEGTNVRITFPAHRLD